MFSFLFQFKWIVLLSASEPEGCILGKAQTQTQALPPMAPWSWADYLVFLRLSYFIYKMGKFLLCRLVRTRIKQDNILNLTDSMLGTTTIITIILQHHLASRSRKELGSGLNLGWQPQDKFPIPAHPLRMVLRPANCTICQCHHQVFVAHTMLVECSPECQALL